jgi:hypothetical protein
LKSLARWGLNIGSYLPLCAEIQNGTDLWEAAGMIVNSCLGKLCGH